MTDHTKLRVGIGISGLVEPDRAGAEATRMALIELGTAPAELLFVYASSRYDLAVLLSSIKAESGGAPLVGATTCALIHRGELTPPGEGVAVLALAGGYRFGVGLVTGVNADPVAAGRTLARSARQAADAAGLPHHLLILISDGLVRDNQGLLEGIYRVTGFSVPVVGGVSGDDRRLLDTSVFHDDEAHRDAAVAVWVGSRRPLNVISGKGWQPVGAPLLVTSVDGPIVREIGGAPAADVYREHVYQGRPGPPIPPSLPGGLNAAHLGLIEPDGTLLIRAAFLGEDGQLRTFTPLPPYSAVRFVWSRIEELLDVDEASVTAAVNGTDASLVLPFSCVARLDVLGDRASEEAQRLQRAAGSAPTFGFYTYGEFARTTSVAGYHNATVAIVAL